MGKGNQIVPGSIDEKWVGPVHNALLQMGRSDVLHFASIGGWGQGASLVESSCGSSVCTGVAYAESFRQWNAQMKSAIPGFAGFAGIDWDLEGADDPESPDNSMTFGRYEVMLSMSQALQDDFLVSMVPGQSSFNCRESGFDTSLLHPAESNPNFRYAGKNAYVALYAKCPECFDLVMVQIYETYSLAGFDLYWNGDSGNVGKAGWPRAGSADDQKLIVSNNMKCLVDGWKVDFNGFWDLQMEHISVPTSKVVIGLITPCVAGNMTSPPFKVPFFSGASSSSAWCEGVSQNVDRVRGFAYWSMLKRDGCAIDEVSWLGELAQGMGACQHIQTSTLQLHDPMCHVGTTDVTFTCNATETCCGDKTLTPHCIDATANTCCVQGGIAIACGLGQTCGKNKAGQPACLNAVIHV